MIHLLIHHQARKHVVFADLSLIFLGIMTEMNCQVNIKKITSWYSSILHRYGTKLTKRNKPSNHWFLMLHAHFRSPTTWKLNGRSWGTILEHTWDLIWRPLFALFTAAQYVVRISRVWRRDFAQTPVMIPWWYRHTNKQPQRYHNSRSENVTHDTFPSSMTQWMHARSFCGIMSRINEQD